MNYRPTVNIYTFAGTINKVNGNKIQINQNWDTFKAQLHSEIESNLDDADLIRDILFEALQKVQPKITTRI